MLKKSTGIIIMILREFYIELNKPKNKNLLIKWLDEKIKYDKIKYDCEKIMEKFHKKKRKKKD